MRDNRMKMFLAIIPGCGILVLLQILFFWLAPDTVSRNILYFLLTGISLLHCGISTVTTIKMPWRRCMPFLISGGLIMIGVCIAVICGFVFDISMRTAIYLGISCLLVYIIAAIPVLLSSLGEEPANALLYHESGEYPNTPVNRNGSENIRKTFPPYPTVKRRC